METYILCLTIFIGILTAALALQGIAIFLMYRRVTRLTEQLQKTVTRLSDQSAKIMTQVDGLMSEVRVHVQRYGRVGDEISGRVERTVNGFFDSIDRVGRLASTSASTVVREASAALQGIFTTFSHFGSRNPRRELPPPPHVHSSSLH